MKGLRAARFGRNREASFASGSLTKIGLFRPGVFRSEQPFVMDGNHPFRYGLSVMTFTTKRASAPLAARAVIVAVP